MSAESRFRRVWRWIKDEGNRSTMAFLGTAIVASSAAVVGGYEHFFASGSAPIDQAATTPLATQVGNVNNSGTIVVGNDDTVSINGISFEQYKADLADKAKEIKALLIDQTRTEEQSKLLRAELAEVEQRRADEKASYEAYIKDLEERIARLDRLKGQVPDQLIEQAKAALAKGETKTADKLFAQVEENADPHIAAAAEAAYQRGKLAEDMIHYQDAYRHYERAAQLIPENSVYLNAVGLLADTLGFYDKAIGYYEQALSSDLKTYGEDHPDVATGRNNLGSEWNAEGDYDKAIEYFE
ncbi:MAG: tetratricopeptide repeat protein, partial [Gammaproteobacteria bacterium]